MSVQGRQLSTGEAAAPRRAHRKAVGKTKIRTPRRRLLIDAARRLFHEKGFAATTVDDIMDRVGGSRGTLYVYFGSKLNLFEATVKEEVDSVLSEIDDAFAVSTDGMTFQEAMQKLLLLVQSEAAIGLLRMVIAERHKYPEIGDIYRTVEFRVKETIRSITLSYLRCAAGELQDFLADILYALVGDAQMAILSGSVDLQNTQKRERLNIRRLAVLLSIEESHAASAQRQCSPDLQGPGLST